MSYTGPSYEEDAGIALPSNSHHSGLAPPAELVLLTGHYTLHTTVQLAGEQLS